MYCILIADCPIWYTIQLPPELMCNPKGIFFYLFCEVTEQHKMTWSGLHNVTWYWSQCVHDAGVYFLFATCTSRHGRIIVRGQ